MPALRPALRPELAAAQAACDLLGRCARRGRLPAPGDGTAKGLRERLARLGSTGAELDEQAQNAAALLDACLADSRLQWIFASHSQAQGALALTGIHAGRLTSLVVDRSFVDSEGVRWLVDFRLDGPPQRYDSELAKRIELARALGSEPVRAGIYFPATRRFLER